ncbi:MAG: YtfJ family protein [Syntrophobacteraceae bacterium]
MSLWLEQKQCKIEQRNAIVKRWPKVLILLSAALLINEPVWALEFGEPPPKVELKDKLGGRLDAKPWSSDELQGKLSVIFYVSPDEKDTNNPASEALDKEKFPADRFRSYGIINMAASMLPNFIINSALKEKQERYPKTIYVRDYKKVLVNAWEIADHSSNVMVFDKKGTLIFRKDGKLTAEEIQKLIKTIRDNL